MFLNRNKKNIVYPCEPQFYYIKVGYKGVKIIQACFRDEYSIYSKRKSVSDSKQNKLIYLPTHSEIDG